MYELVRQFGNCDIRTRRLTKAVNRCFPDYWEIATLEVSGLVILLRDNLFRVFEEISRRIDIAFTGSSFFGFDVSQNLRVIVRLNNRGRLSAFYIYRNVGSPRRSLIWDSLYRLVFTACDVEWEALLRYSIDPQSKNLPRRYRASDDGRGVVFTLEGGTFYLEMPDIARVEEVINEYR